MAADDASQDKGRSYHFLHLALEEIEHLPIPAPESPCDSSMGMKGAFLIGDGEEWNALEPRTNALDSARAML
jgi:hypothetical protein